MKQCVKYCNAAVCKPFNSQTEAFGKILFPFMRSTLGDNKTSTSPESWKKLNAQTKVLLYYK